MTDISSADARAAALTTIFLGERLGLYRALADLEEATPFQPAAMRRMVEDGGTVMIGDERVAETFTAPGDPIERLMYAASMVHCLPVGMSEEPSVATGTVMRQETLRRYAREDGFRAVDVLPIENEVWQFYRLSA